MTLKKQENIVYLVVWTLVFLAPLTKLLTSNSVYGPEDAWNAIFRSWLMAFPLLVLFLIHNFVAIPFLLDKDRKGIYAVITILLVGSLTAYSLISSKTDRHFGSGPRDEMMWRLGAPPPEDRLKDAPIPKDGSERRNAPPDGVKHKKAPMKPLSEELTKLILILLVLGSNLAVSLFFNSIRNERKMKELEKEKLNSQLQYLRYQISPHFFMNTLNNIHALVDIDPSLAKESILRLSKLMRYMLYEGDRPTIPLEKEISFLSQYAALMRLRYNDSVKISFSVPEDVPGVEIPPLLFISFVENAFKHGISYRNESFIDISIKLSGNRVAFDCRNSRYEESSPNKEGGVGMNNTQHRLDLLYGKNYALKIENKDNVYSVHVDIPTQREALLKPEIL